MANAIHIYGRHAVREALQARPDTVREVFFANNFEDDNLRSLASREGVQTHSFQPDSPPRSVTAEDTHQGVVAKIDTDTLTENGDTFLADLSPDADDHLLIVGELEDPHNVGSVIRSAAAFGFAGVLIPQHRQTQVTPAVVKVSSGMAFRVPLVSIGNVNTVIEKLKDAEYWVYGLDQDSSDYLHTEDMNKPTALVVGNEADGIRTKTKEHCDRLLAIPAETDRPLNASVAAAVGMYAVRTNIS